MSNYDIQDLKELLENFDITPAVNQVEFHPFLYQQNLADTCWFIGLRLFPRIVFVVWIVIIALLLVTAEEGFANMEVSDFTFEDNRKYALRVRQGSQLRIIVRRSNGVPTASKGRY